MTETQEQVARLRSALNDLSDLTGGTRSHDADLAFSEAWRAMCMLEMHTGIDPAMAEGAA